MKNDEKTVYHYSILTGFFVASLLRMTDHAILGYNHTARND